MIRLPGAGERFGRYQMVRKLGQGGMGIVYAARDTSLGRDVALKLVTPQHASDAGFRARFSHEAATLAKLESPRIVRIYDYGEQDDVLFLVTQLVEGGDLSGLVRRTGPLSPGQAVGVVAQVLEGLADAHAVNVVHRDIKPANVLMRGAGADLEAFLCDFGIATMPGAELSRTGTLAGSLPYMAPERHQGVEAGAGGDVYAAGCVLWFALTGAAPYAGTDVEMAMAHLQAPIRQLPGKDKFSVAVNEVLRTAMAKDPRKRYSSARAMLDDLLRVGGLAPDAVALPGNTSLRQELVLGSSKSGGSSRWSGRWVPAGVAALATAAVLLTTLLVGGSLGGPSTDPAERRALSLGTGATGSGDVSGSDDVRLRDDPTVEGQSGGARNRPSKTSALDVGDALMPDQVGPGKGTAQGGTGGEKTANPRTSKKATTTPRTTTKPPAPVVLPITCWNGKKTTSKSACHAPYGKPGAMWVFPGLRDESCSRITVNGAAEAWRCKYGATSHITVARWGSVAKARSYYQRLVRINRQVSPWVVSGHRWGTKYIGRHKVSGKVRYTNARVYSALSWSVSVDSASTGGRTTGTNKVGGTRKPADLKGVRTG